MTKKNRSDNKLLFGLLLIVVLLTVMAIIGKNQGWIGKGDSIDVTLAHAKKVSITEKVSASGMVQPVLEVKISPEVPGEIIELAIEEGDQVKKGDLLIRIKPDNFVSALERAQASLNQQRANLADAEAKLARANAQFIRSELEYKRNQQLYSGKAISDADMELAEANYKIAKEDLRSAQQNVEAAKYIVQSALATVREAKENLGFTTIRSPMTGTVSMLNVEKGERVVGTSQMAGTEMLRIADLNQMEVRVDVNENDIVRVSIGDTVIIDVDAYSYLEKQFEGIVTAIANTANEKVTADAITEFEVKIKILNESFSDLISETKVSPFRPGMTASVDIITEIKKDVLSVPLGAVTTRSKDIEDENIDQRPINDEDIMEVVFINDNGRAILKEVKTGISDFENIEILNGIPDSAEIITGPFLTVTKKLEDGDRIEQIKRKKRRKRKS